MATRRSVWSDERVHASLERFVPAADEVHRLKVADSREGRLFRRIAEQGHYAGRTQPTSTRQGIYATAPSGVLLASVNTRSAERVLAMLDEAWEAWEDLAPAQRYLPAGEAAGHGGFRWRERFPADGLVLRVYTRDLPREDAPADWRAAAANRDHAWFRRAEVEAFLPGEIEVGAVGTVPEELVRRLARFHFLDTVRGQAPAFAAEHVERATLRAEVTAVAGERVELALEGSTRAVARGAWPVAGYEDMDAPTEQERGVETRLRGRAVWDRAAGRFTSFGLVALGERWGGSQYNARGDDLGATGIGFALLLAGDGERVPPAMVWQYGWDD